MSANYWGGVLAAVVSPMDTRGNVNYKLAANLCSDLIENGCDGVVITGTTGEAATLSAQEKLDLFSSVKERVGRDGIVIGGVGGNCTRETIALVERAESRELDGYMVITPYYNKPNKSGLIAHYRAVSAASSRPIMLYNVPSRTGLEMSLMDYEAVLGSCPNITAVKEASPDFDKAASLPARFDNIVFLSGNDSLTLPLMAMGFSGVVSVAANLVPGAMAKMVSLARSGDWAEARTVHTKLAPLFKAVFVETNPVPVKAGLEIQGWPVGSPRLPLGDLDHDNRRMLEKLLADFKREGL